MFDFSVFYKPNIKYNMENNSQPRKKTNSLFEKETSRSHSLPFTQILEKSHETEATNILIELAENQSAMPPASIEQYQNGWLQQINNQKKPNIRIQNVKSSKKYRQSSYIKPCNIKKKQFNYLDQFQDQKISSISHLKYALQKLESPKRKIQTAHESKFEIKQQLHHIDSKLGYQDNQVNQENYFMKQRTIRIKNSSKDNKKEIKVITFKNYKQNSQKRVIVKQPSDEHFQSIKNRLFLIKQARKNRTLRSILS